MAIRRAPDLDWRYVESTFQDGLWHYPLNIDWGEMKQENTAPKPGLTQEALLSALEKLWTIPEPERQTLVIHSSPEGLEMFQTDRDVPLVDDDWTVVRYRIGQDNDPNVVVLEMDKMNG